MVVSQPWNRPNRLAYLRRSALADNDIDFAVLGGEMEGENAHANRRIWKSAPRQTTLPRVWY